MPTENIHCGGHGYTETIICICDYFTSYFGADFSMLCSQGRKERRAWIHETTEESEP